MENKKVKKRTQEVKSTQNVVRNIVNSLDFLGYIALGAPDDEYDPQVDEISKRMDYRLDDSSDFFSESKRSLR